MAGARAFAAADGRDTVLWDSAAPGALRARENGLKTRLVHRRCNGAVVKRTLDALTVEDARHTRRWRYADPSRCLDMTVRVHGLAGARRAPHSDWGVSGQLRLVQGGGGRGLSMSLTPSWGVGPGGSERLWALPDASALAANDNAPLASRLDGEVGDGMALYGDRFTGTPNVGFGLPETARELRLGWRLSPAGTGYGGFEFRLDAARRDRRRSPPRAALQWAQQPGACKSEGRCNESGRGYQ